MSYFSFHESSFDYLNLVLSRSNWFDYIHLKQFSILSKMIAVSYFICLISVWILGQEQKIHYEDDNERPQ